MNDKKLEMFLDENFNLQERIEAFRKRKLYSLEIEITRACNLSCFYCYANQDNRTNLNFEKAKEIIDEAKAYGIERISWLGGEPTLNPDWKDIIEYSKSRGLSNELWSNGVTLLDNASAIAESCDRFVLHLDSIDYNVFASAQGSGTSPNIHSKILRGLDHLLGIGYSPDKIRLTTVLSRRTLPHLRETMKYFYPEKVSDITLIPLFSIGKGNEVSENSFLSHGELQGAFELRALVENRPERLLTGTAEFDKWYQMTNAYIKANGDVSPYAGLDTSVGNIYEKDLGDILKGSFDLLSFSQAVGKDGAKNKISGKCGKCGSSKYCFGTRANSYFTSGNLLESDNTCWK